MNIGSEGAAWQRAIILVVVAVMMFSLLDTVGKYLVRSYPVPMIAWARYFFHLATFGVLVIFTHRSVAVRTKRLPLHILRGLLLVGVTLFFIAALAHIPLADATAISFVTPLLVTALSVVILREKVGWSRWLAVALGFSGVLAIVRPGAGVADWGAAYAIGMALCYAFYQIATRAIGRTEHSVTSMFYLALVGTIATSAVVPFFWMWPAPIDLALMALAGILGGGGHFLLIQALRYAEASLIAPLFYVQIVFATAISVLFFGDMPDGWVISGSALIVCAGLWSWAHERTTRRGKVSAKETPFR